MRAVLLSVKPQHIQNICEVIGESNGKPLYKKTIEVRKSKPKLETPFKVYIYCTKEKRKDDFITISGVFGLIRCPECAIYNRAKEYDCNGKVIGEFVCDRIEFISPEWRYLDARCVDGAGYILGKSCLTSQQLLDYGQGKPLYGWHISNLVIYDKPKELSEFEFPKDNIHLSYRKRNQYFKGITRPPQSWCYVE